MCQLATRPSTSPAHSCYQPPTISLSHTHSPTHTHPPGSVQPLLPFSTSLPPPFFLSLCSLVDTWHIAFCPPPPLISVSSFRPPLSPSPCFTLLCFFSFGISLHLYSVACLHSLVSSFSIIAHDRIPYILVCFSGSLGVPLLCYSSYRPTHQMLADLCLQSAHPLMHVVFKNNKTKQKQKQSSLHMVFLGV